MVGIQAVGDVDGDVVGLGVGSGQMTVNERIGMEMNIPLVQLQSVYRLLIKNTGSHHIYVSRAVWST